MISCPLPWDGSIDRRISGWLSAIISELSIAGLGVCSTVICYSNAALSQKKFGICTHGLRKNLHCSFKKLKTNDEVLVKCEFGQDFSPVTRIHTQNSVNNLNYSNE